MFEKGGNPGNNLLPKVPDLMQVFNHPVVHGALQSILGHDYYLHLHRHVHDRPPGGKDQKMHKDSLHNSRFAVGRETSAPSHALGHALLLPAGYTGGPGADGGYAQITIS